MNKSAQASILAAQTLDRALDQALALAQQGEFDAAIAVLKPLRSRDFAVDEQELELLRQAKHLQALLHKEQGDLPAMRPALEAALQAVPGHVLVLNDYANVLLELQAWAEAKAALQELLQAAQGDAAIRERAHMGLAHLAYEEGDTAQAMRHLDVVIAQQGPLQAQALSNRSMLYAKQGQGAAAKADAQRALALDDSNVQAQLNLAVSAYASGEFEVCVSGCEQVLAQAPHYLPAWLNLGQAKVRLGDYAGAQAALAQVLALQPGHKRALGQLVLCAYYRLDDAALAQALADCEAIENDFSTRWKRLMSSIVVFYDAPAQARKARRSFMRELAYVGDWLQKNGQPPEAWQEVGEPISHFYYIYHGLNDMSLLSAYGDVCASLMQGYEGRWPKPAAAARPPVGELSAATQAESEAKRPWRLGVVSHHIRAHSIWWDKLQGLYLHAPDDVELHTFALGTLEDEQTELARQGSAFFLSGALGLEDWVQAIAQQDVDFLYYPEVGLGGLSYKLACLRLAPRQFSSWGNPQTTGLPEMDAYISARCFEPAADSGAGPAWLEAGALPDYRETVGVLAGFPTYYQPYAGEIEAFDLAAMGFAESSKLLLCPGSAFKYQYDFAAQYAELAAQIADAQLVFFMGDGEMAERVAAQLRQAFMERGLAPERLLFSPWLSRPRYQYLMQRSWLLLDSWGFSGINTVLQALDVGLPVVTLRGESLRGRLGSGVLDAVGMGHWVAEAWPDYLTLAKRLCERPEQRQAYAQELKDKREAMFWCTEPIEQTFALLRQWGESPRL